MTGRANKEGFLLFLRPAPGWPISGLCRSSDGLTRRESKRLVCYVNADAFAKGGHELLGHRPRITIRHRPVVDFGHWNHKVAGAGEESLVRSIKVVRLKLLLDDWNVQLPGQVEHSHSGDTL